MSWPASIYLRNLRAGPRAWRFRAPSRPVAVAPSGIGRTGPRLPSDAHGPDEQFDAKAQRQQIHDHLGGDHQPRGLTDRGYIPVPRGAERRGREVERVCPGQVLAEGGGAARPIAKGDIAATWRRRSAPAGARGCTPPTTGEPGERCGNCRLCTPSLPAPQGRGTSHEVLRRHSEGTGPALGKPARWHRSGPSNRARSPKHSGRWYRVRAGASRTLTFGACADPGTRRR
jgi:hypothetical protein